MLGEQKASEPTLAGLERPSEARSCSGLALPNVKRVEMSPAKSEASLIFEKDRRQGSFDRFDASVVKNDNSMSEPGVALDLSNAHADVNLLDRRASPANLPAMDKSQDTGIHER